MKKLCICMLVVLMLSGCASFSGDTYSRDEARQVQYIETGVILSVKPVKIEGESSGFGALAGAALGGIAGAQVGGGSGRWAGAIAGGALGGLAGHGAEKALTSDNGLEIVVKLDNGETLAVVQDNDMPFNAGQRVRVATSTSGVTRVRPY